MYETIIKLLNEFTAIVSSPVYYRLLVVKKDNSTNRHCFEFFVNGRHYGASLLDEQLEDRKAQEQLKIGFKNLIIYIQKYATNV